MTNDCDEENIYKPICATRIENNDRSFWIELTNLGKQYNALNLGQGFPDYHLPELLRKSLLEVAFSEDHSIHQYARSYGHPRLVTALAKLYSEVMSRTIDPMNNILVTVGGSNALYNCAQTYINPGDEAIIIEPCFDVCESQVQMAGGIPIAVPLRYTVNDVNISSNAVVRNSSEWKLNFEELESKFSSKTKLLYITNPHNPTGKVFTRDELLQIAELAEKYNVTVIADEVYEWIVFENAEMIKFSTLPNMWKRTLTIGSAGKTFSVTGWKTGWIIGPENLLKNIRAIHHNNLYMCPTPLQEALAIGFEGELALLNSSNSYLKRLSHDMKLKRDRMAELLKKMGLVPIIPDGAYFMLADFSKIEHHVDDKNGLTKDFAFVRWMCIEKGVLATPGSPFYCKKHKHMGENLIRFCFCKKDATFEAAEKLVESWHHEL